MKVTIFFKEDVSKPISRFLMKLITILLGNQHMSLVFWENHFPFNVIMREVAHNCIHQVLVVD